MVNLTNICLLILLMLFPNKIANLFTVNFLNPDFLNLPLHIDLLNVFNYLLSASLLVIFLILSIYAKVYMEGNYNYPYFEYVYNIFFISMLLLLCSGNTITTLIA